MIRITLSLIAALISLTQCTNSSINEEQSKLTSLNNSMEVDGSHTFIDTSQFKYKNLSQISSKHIEKQGLSKIDSTFHNQIISQIDGYNLAFDESNENYFISIQQDIYNYNCILVSLYYGVCFDGVFLLLIDDDKELVNCVPVTELYSSCDLITSTYTKFLTNTRFKMFQKTIEPGFYDYITELIYIGEFNQQGKIDTIEVLLNEEYEK